MRLEFEAFYEEYYSSIYNYVYFTTREPDAAEDLTGTIFEKIFRNQDQFDEEKSSLATWVYAIARNQITDHYRTGSKKSRLFSQAPLPEELPDQTPGPEEKLLADHRQELLHGQLALLPQRDREVLVLRYYGNCSSKEIATMMKTTEAHINVVVHRALRKLKKGIMEHQVDL